MRNPFKQRGHKGIYGISGKGAFDEKTIFGIGFFTRVTNHTVSPTAYRQTNEFGIRLFNFTISFGSTYLHFKDGKSPEKIRLQGLI